MKLPHGAHAVVDIARLRDYCLSPDHPRGRHKARLCGRSWADISACVRAASCAFGGRTHPRSKSYRSGCIWPKIRCGLYNAGAEWNGLHSKQLDHSQWGRLPKGCKLLRALK